jgi:hypothetical protein
MAVLALVILALPPVTAGQETEGAHWSVQLFGGSAASVPTTLTVHQDGFPDIRMTAHYATRPWTGAPYYAVRIARWTRGHAWEIELLHHKLYLTNPPDEIQHLEVTHGYNLVTVNRAAVYRGFVVRAGVGVVVAHPESRIRGRAPTSSGGGLGGGYYLTGPTVQLAAAKRFTLWRGLFAALEGKATGAYARFPIASGRATAPNVAVHGLVGLGWEM